MLFFRSEERVREWCAAHNYPMRPLVTMDQLWTLATTWYSTRLQENSRRPQPDEMRSNFARLGLEGDFGIRSRVVSVNRSLLNSEIPTSDFPTPSQLSTNDSQLLSCW